jgi:tight adherence protein B
VVIALGLAAGLVIGAPLPALAALGLAVWQPVWALAAILAWSVLAGQHNDSSTEDAEAAYLQAVGSELRAGSSLRHSLSSAASRVAGLQLDRVVRLATAGRPLAQVAQSLERALPRLGALTASAVRTAGVTGGRAADVFDALSVLAAEETALVRERRTATAQARISAWIVGGLPVVYLLYAAVSGKLAVLLSVGPAGSLLLVVGLLLLTGGVGVMWGMLRKAEQ